MNLMGVDLGIHKVSMFLLLDQGQVHVSTVDLADSAELSRARQLQALASGAYHQALMWGIDCVWIEDTLVGNNRGYSLALTEVKGALMATLASQADIRLVNVGTWKKQVVGQGHATKDDVKYYIDVTYPAYAPLCGDNQDLYDAACVALYGRQILDRAADLRLLPG